MAKLPTLSATKTISTFVVLGWRVARQKGSHIVMIKAGESTTLSIPNHPEVARGTLRSLIRLAGITVDEFVAAIP